MSGSGADRELRERIEYLASELTKAQAELRKREAEKLDPEERRRRFRVIRGGGLVALLLVLVDWLKQHARRPEVVAAGSVIAVAAVTAPLFLNSDPPSRLAVPEAPATVVVETPVPLGEGEPTSPPLSPVEVELDAPPTPDPGSTEVRDPGFTEAVPLDPDITDVAPPATESGGGVGESPGVEEPEPTPELPEPDPPVEDPGGDEVDESLLELCLAAEVIGLDLEICAGVL